MQTKDILTERVAAFHDYDEALRFAEECAALYGAEVGEIYTSETWNGFKVPSINIIQVMSNGDGDWLVMRDSVPVAWSTPALLNEAGLDTP